MKIRMGFVSNSSSSSFVISKKGLTDEQIDGIRSWLEYEQTEYDETNFTETDRNFMGNISQHVEKQPEEVAKELGLPDNFIDVSN